MILTGKEIYKEYVAGNILIDPFNIERLNPNSYNVSLASGKIYSPVGLVDLKRAPTYEEYLLTSDGLWLEPGKIYLMSTIEKAGSDKYIPMLEGRSSLARLGIAVHITAGFGDVGFKQQWTLEIKVSNKTKIYPFIEIAQVYFVDPKGELDLYHGKYSKQEGPAKSKFYKEFE